MKLKTIVISGFRSIKGTEEIRVDDKITILIGANDHGKSNILEAIKALNDDRPFEEDDRNWDLSVDANVRVEWHFDLDADEKLATKIAELKPREEQADEDSSEEEPEKYLSLEGLPEDVRNELTRILSLDSSAFTDTDKEFLKARRDYLTAEQRETFAGILEAPDDVDDETDENESDDDSGNAEGQNNEVVAYITKNNENKIVFYREGVGLPVKVLSVPEDEIAQEDEEYILKLRPRVELFEAQGNNLRDKVNKKDLEKPEYEFMQGIFRLANIWKDKDTIFRSDLRTKRLLKEASERLTKVLNQDWNQGRDLEWLLQHSSGGDIEIMIQDPSINTRYTHPSSRSSGFKTYFVTSMVIRARTANNPNHSYIYLFDEPGIYLHPQAQLDLQRAYEIIADDAQIAYTTHSLFLINKNYPERNKVISKTSDGTKIDQKPYLHNWKSVRESLGILLSNNFLIADKTLVVEGPSDFFYLLGAIKQLKKDGKVDIDLNDLSMVDGGNAQNYVSMTKLMLSEGRDIVSLIDGDTGGDKIKKELDKVCEKEIKDKKLTIVQLSKDKSIEDYCVSIPTLKEVIKDIINDLITLGVRTLKSSINLDNELKKIKRVSGKTLGKTIDETTEGLFEPKDAVSKLSIAIRYEDSAKNKSLKPKDDLIKLILEIKKLLKLKGEKSAEKGVFEEAA